MVMSYSQGSVISTEKQHASIHDWTNQTLDCTSYHFHHFHEMPSEVSTPDQYIYFVSLMQYLITDISVALYVYCLFICQ